MNGYATLVGSLKWSVPVAVLTGTVSYLSNGRLAALAASGWLASGAGDDYSSARHDEGYNSMTGLRMSGGVDAMGNAQGMDNSSASHEPPAPVFTPNSHDGGSWS